MKNIYYTFFIILFFASCASARVDSDIVQTEIFAPYKSVEDDIPYKILDYQNNVSTEGLGQSADKAQERQRQLPSWLRAYMAGGIPTLEKLDSYNSRYCFVNEYTSTSLNMIQRRAASYTAERDFPQAALLRIYNAGVKDLSISPDVVYGSEFEKLMKRIVELNWQDVRIEASVWIFISWTNLNGSKNSSDVSEEGMHLKDCYKLFILTSIDINDFKKQFEDAMLLVQSDKTDTRSQNSAFAGFTRSIWEKF
jgi:hypothetical protein